jgi:hypothetical protein
MFVSGLAGGALGYSVAAPLFYATRVAQAEAGVLRDGVFVTGARAGHPPSTPGGSSGVPMLVHLARRDGPLRLWKGAPLLVARGALMSATQLATYDLTKARLRALGFADGPAVHSAASLAASLALTTAICPLDVTLTRFQAGPLLGHDYASPLAAANALVREGGALALFRGWAPLWARFLPSSVLTFHIYEQARRLLGSGYLD